MMYHPVYWTVAWHMVQMAEVLIMGYCFYRFVVPFMKRKRTARCSAAAYFFFIFVLTVLLNRGDILMVYGIGILAALVMCRMERHNYEQKIFLVITFCALELLSRNMAEILYDNLYWFVEHTEFMRSRLHLWFALYVGVSLFYLALKFAFTMIGIKCIVGAYSYKYVQMSLKELFMLTIPSLMGVSGYVVTHLYRTFYIIENEKINSAYDVLFFLYCFVSVMTIVVVIALYQSIKAKQEEETQGRLLAAQVESIRKHIEQVEGLYRNIRSLKHDMGNHILTLERLYEGQQTEEAKAYGIQLKNALSEAAGGIKSGNPVTDVILQEFKAEAEKRGIYFQLAFSYPADARIDAFDVSVILNNALQNAMENVGEGEAAYISVLSYRKNNAYMIEIKNSFTKELQWDAETGLPVSSKEKVRGGYGTNARDEQMHGYGVSNIRRVARKYAGDIDIAVKEGEFCLSVMLMLV